MSEVVKNMSSQYPILGNRPIDQWKVTELKEELKKRKLTTGGLKNDLIRRLEEALHVERESATEGVHNGLSMDPQPLMEASNAAGSAGVTELAGDTRYDIGEVSEDVEVIEEVHNVAKEAKKVGNVVVLQDIENSAIAISEAKPQDEIIVGDISSRVEEELSVHATTEHSDSAATDGVVSEELLFVQVALSSGTLDVNEKIKNEESKDWMLNEDLKPLLENEGLKFPQEDPTVESSAPTKQVSEVSPNLGFPVKSDSITADSVSINEKIELKDNIIDDNVKLELDVVKQESVGGESHPMDVEEPQEKKASVEEEDCNNAIDADMSKKIDVVDIGYSEKLNLDRSSGDDSMEEDVMESKQIESKFHFGEMGDGLDNGKAPALKEGDVDIVGGDILTEQNETHGKSLMNQSLPAEKRKLHDQEFVGNAEMLKRQRRWNSESLKIPELHTLHHAPTVTPKDAIQPAHLRCNFSRCDSSIGEDTPKERVVPPSPKPPTDSLRIDRFLRPFTLKAVQELLGKTGTVKSFWMDQIKTHCYVTYSSVDEAIETRNAVYNLQWPSNGGRLLVAEFVHPQEVKLRVEAPQDSTAPVTPTAAIIPTTAPSIALPQPSPRKQVSTQQLPPLPLLPPSPPLSNPHPVKDRLGLYLPPLPPEKHDPPIITLDDLFWKTKTTPRIYYLPLSEERVAEKLAQQTKNAKQ